MTAPRERPIIFSMESVRAIQAGRKTQTRRVVKARPDDGAFILLETSDGSWWPHRSRDGEDFYPYGEEIPYNSPYGAPGDRLWGREGWRLEFSAAREEHFVRYRADDSRVAIPNLLTLGSDDSDKLCGICEKIDWQLSDIPCTYVSPWRSPLFMPRWASRILLEVTEVQVERLHAITESDAEAEGCERRHDVFHPEIQSSIENSRRRVYAVTWDRLNGKKHPWASDPWCWRICFRRIEQ